MPKDRQGHHHSYNVVWHVDDLVQSQIAGDAAEEVCLDAGQALLCDQSVNHVSHSSLRGVKKIYRRLLSIMIW